MTTNTGGPAFPAIAEGGDASGLSPAYNEGMTLRDYFAAKAMQGFCANPAVFASNPMSGWGLVNSSEQQLADYCNAIADAMLAARSK